MPPKRKSNKQPDAVIVETITVTNNQPAIVQPAIVQPAIVQPAIVQPTVVTNAPQTTSSAEDDKKNNKRRGRKPKDKFNIDDAYTEQNNSLLDFDNNIIIKLPIACKDLENELSMVSNSVLYNPVLSEPKPFNECYENNYELLETPNMIDQLDGGKQANHGLQNNNQPGMIFNNNELFDNNGGMRNLSSGSLALKSNQHQPQSAQNQAIQPNYMDYYQTKINDLLSDLDDSAVKKRLTQIEILLNKKYKTAKQIDLLHTLSVTYEGTNWPQTSNICCFWCCHNFDNTPWGIPKKYNADTGIFTMYGIFCSPNCVIAHLLRNESNNVCLWEYISLLNLLHYKIYETDENIVPAPDNICLKMFGGPLNIQEFRALTLKNDKKYAINFPPCVIITPVLEETKKVFNQDSYYIPIDKKRINKIQTELKIKRTNNVYKNSLENVMNISYTA